MKSFAPCNACKVCTVGIAHLGNHHLTGVWHANAPVSSFISELYNCHTFLFYVGIFSLLVLGYHMLRWQASDFIATDEGEVRCRAIGKWKPENLTYKC